MLIEQLDADELHALVATPLGQATLFRKCRMALHIDIAEATEYEDSLLAGIISNRRLRRCENAECPFPPRAWTAIRQALKFAIDRSRGSQTYLDYLYTLFVLVVKAEGQLWHDDPVARSARSSAGAVD